MKVLKNSEGFARSEEPVKLICDMCHAELEVSKEDCQIGWNGWCYAICPCCGDKIYPEAWDALLDEKNIEYPLHFSDTDNQTKVDDDKIQDAVRKGAKIMRDNPQYESWYWQSGDTLITIFRNDGEKELDVYISKSPQECYLPYEYWS